MPLMKGALHTHTTLSDGRMTPEEVCATYAELGFDFIAITDHDYLLRPDHRARLPESTASLLVFPGAELTIHERGYIHVNRIEGEREVLHIFNHPAEYDLPLDDLLQVLEAVARKVPIDAVEISAQGFYTATWDDPRIPYPKVASDDSHTRQSCGRAWIEVDCERDRDAIIRAIRAGEAKPRFR
jgi:predicted metal-dependent phosphoesterase TrpH